MKRENYKNTRNISTKQFFLWQVHKPKNRSYGTALLNTTVYKTLRDRQCTCDEKSWRLA